MHLYFSANWNMSSVYPCSRISPVSPLCSTLMGGLSFLNMMAIISCFRYSRSFWESFWKTFPWALVPLSALLATSCRQIIYLQIHFGEISHGIFGYFYLFFHLQSLSFAIFLINCVLSLLSDCIFFFLFMLWHQNVLMSRRMGIKFFAVILLWLNFNFSFCGSICIGTEYKTKDHMQIP